MQLMMREICENCGAKVDKENRFCPQCGANLEQLRARQGKHLEDLMKQSRGKESLSAPFIPKNITKDDVDSASSISENEAEIKQCLAMLDSMEGLEAVKNEVLSMVNFIKTDKVRTEVMGYPTRFPRKFIFIGKPNTGRKTVARLLANLLHKLEVMPEHTMITVWSQALMGNSVLQSEATVRHAVESAIGGVLFIDDVHLLCDVDNPLSIGALKELVVQLNKHSDNLVCIVAVPYNEAQAVLDERVGLHSHFDRKLLFER